MMTNKKRLVDVNYALRQLEIGELENGGNFETDSYHIKEFLNVLPTVDAVEVVHGRWVGYHEADIGYDEYGVRCSNCNFEVEDHEVDFIMNYCPQLRCKDGW